MRETEIQLSVITPVYNTKRYIESCIKNVIEQYCASAEHIIIDGGSTDGTVEIIKRYAEQYPHIRWISEADKGQSDAMNKGFRISTGGIVGYLNADDYYEPGAFEKVIGYFNEHPGLDIVVGKLRVITAKGTSWINDPRIAFSDMLHWWKPDAYAYNPTAYFFKRDVHDRVGGFNIEQHHSMDWEFLMAASLCCKFGKLDALLGNFRLHKNTKTYRTQRVDDLTRKFSSAMKFAQYLPFHEQEEFIRQQNEYIRMAYRREKSFLNRIWPYLSSER